MARRTCCCASSLALPLLLTMQGAAEHIIFSGAHPGGGIRGDTEAHVMTVYAQSLVESKPPSGRYLQPVHAAAVMVVVMVHY